MVAVWPGDEHALHVLQDAVNHNCTCRDAEQTCPAHKMLCDQDALNHLAYVKQTWDQWAEWRTGHHKAA